MTTSITTNVSAQFAQNNLRAAGADAQSSIARLSSGNRIIRAADDVAGLSIGTILRTDVSTLKTALSNTAQAASLIQVADGALERLGEILQRQKALSVQGNADTLSDTERGYLDQEFQALVSEYDRIVSETNFNGTTLLDGNLASSTTTLATEDPTAFTVALTDSDDSIDTAVLTGGTSALTVATVGDNDRSFSALQGSLDSLSVSIVDGTADDDATITIEINGVVFKGVADGLQTDAANTNIVLTQTLTASETTDGDTAMILNLDVADLGEATPGATELATIEQNIQTELRKLSVYQDRVLENTIATDSSAVDVTKFEGTVLQGLDGADFQLVGTGFSATDGKAPAISAFTVDSISATLATFTVDIGGVTYSSANVTGNETGVTVDGDVSDDDLGGGNGVIRLQSADDSNSYLDINLLAADSGGVISIASDSDAAGLAAALNGAFGSGAQGGASFQVGTSSTDTISVAISSVSTTAVYKNDAGVTQTLAVGTKAGSIAASAVLDNAINSLTAVRADVGAAQSRFSFAAAALEVSIQNIDAARAGFLDADISTESTAFAQNQVLIQASISVLAQANQLPQNLLKLIG